MTRDDVDQRSPPMTASLHARRKIDLMNLALAACWLVVLVKFFHLRTGDMPLGIDEMIPIKISEAMSARGSRSELAPRRLARLFPLLVAFAPGLVQGAGMARPEGLRYRLSALACFSGDSGLSGCDYCRHRRTRLWAIMNRHWSPESVSFHIVSDVPAMYMIGNV
jgi:hypothetical protein